MRHNGFTITCLMLPVVLAAGCMPPSLTEGVPWAVRQYHVHDAKTQNVKASPYLRVNGFLLDRLTAAGQADDLPVAKQNLQRVLKQCRRLAVDATNNEMDRLPSEAIEKLWKTYYPNRARSADARKVIREKYSQFLDNRYKDFQKQLSQEQSIEGLRATVRDIIARTEPSPKDHYGHGLLLNMVMASHPEDRGPLDKGGPNIDLYLPDASSLASFQKTQQGDDENITLLARFAPRIVQERISGASYPPEYDMIGTVALKGRNPNYQVVIDTQAPSVYAYWQNTLIDGRQHVQLIYTYWFPDRPAMKFGDSESGHIDGSTVRITLDSTSRPAFFEAIMNCGCHHRCYPSTATEAAAKRIYHAPLKNKRFVLERRMLHTPDWILPETVDVPDAPDVRPIIFIRSGYHLVAAVSFDEHELAKRNVLHRRTYTLRPYRNLERLPAADGVGSMFGADGLVHHAGRLEGWLLSGTGMLSAGQPRQRGTRRIYWDQYDFDDPHLLEKCLRLPKNN